MGKTSGFDLASILGNVSKLDTANGKEQIEYIEMEKLGADENNFYAITGVDELATNIQLCGLQQPLRVRQLDHDDEYVIVSGHRRFAALRKLAAEVDPSYSRIPCIVEHDDASQAMRELRLIFANSATRVLTSAELSHQAERVEALLYQLKEEGVEFPGRMRDQVAAACQTSSTKLARLKVIREKLIPEYKAQFDKNKMPEQVAYEMAGMPKAFQQRCAKVVKTSDIRGYTLDSIRKKLENGCTYTPIMSCPDGRTCGHGDAFLRHDFKCFSGEMCGGNRCCLKCDRAFYSYSACENACSKAKAKRKAESDAEKERQAIKEEKEKSKAQVNADRIAEYWKRIEEALVSAGHDEIDSKLLMSIGVPSYDAAPVLRMMNGLYKASQYDDGSRYLPSVDVILAVCDMVGCSANYLLYGDEQSSLACAAALEQWHQDTEYPHGKYLVVLFYFPGAPRLIRQLAYAWGGRLYNREDLKTVIEMEPVAWFVQPDLPPDLLPPSEQCDDDMEDAEDD